MSPTCRSPSRRWSSAPPATAAPRSTTAFNDTHIAAITQAIVEYRTEQGTTGPLFIGRDTHALSAPAEQTALQVLAANGVRVLADAEDASSRPPALSHAIIKYNREEHGDTADGIVITPSHNPPA